VGVVVVASVMRSRGPAPQRARALEKEHEVVVETESAWAGLGKPDLYEQKFHTLGGRMGGWERRETGPASPCRPYDKFFSGPPSGRNVSSALPVVGGPAVFHAGSRPSAGRARCATGLHRGVLFRNARRRYFFSGSWAFSLASSNWRLLFLLAQAFSI